eukprot:gene3434-3899_t
MNGQILIVVGVLLGVSFVARFFQKRYKIVNIINLWCQNADAVVKILVIAQEYDDAHYAQFRQHMNEQLARCPECTLSYHKSRKVLKENMMLQYTPESVEKVQTYLTKRDHERIGESIHKYFWNAQTRDVNKLKNIIYEVFHHPDLLDNKELYDLFTRTLHDVVDAYQLALMSGQKVAGVYLMLMSKSQLLREWSAERAADMGPIAGSDEYLVVHPILEQIVRTLASLARNEPITSNFSDIPALWSGFEVLLSQFTPNALANGISNFFPEFVTLIFDLLLIAPNRPPTQPAFIACISAVVERLGSNVWRYAPGHSPKFVADALIMLFNGAGSNEELQRTIFTLLDVLLIHNTLEQEELDSLKKSTIEFCLQQIAPAIKCAPSTKTRAFSFVIDIVLKSFSAHQPVTIGPWGDRLVYYANNQTYQSLTPKPELIPRVISVLTYVLLESAIELRRRYQYVYHADGPLERQKYLTKSCEFWCEDTLGEPGDYLVMLDLLEGESFSRSIFTFAVSPNKKVRDAFKLLIMKKYQNEKTITAAIKASFVLYPNEGLRGVMSVFRDISYALGAEHLADSPLYYYADHILYQVKHQLPNNYTFSYMPLILDAMFPTVELFLTQKPSPSETDLRSLFTCFNDIYGIMSLERYASMDDKPYPSFLINHLNNGRPLFDDILQYPPHMRPHIKPLFEASAVTDIDSLPPSDAEEFINLYDSFVDDIHNFYHTDDTPLNQTQEMIDATLLTSIAAHHGRWIDKFISVRQDVAELFTALVQIIKVIQKNKFKPSKSLRHFCQAVIEGKYPFATEAIRNQVNKYITPLQQKRDTVIPSLPLPSAGGSSSSNTPAISAYGQSVLANTKTYISTKEDCPQGTACTKLKNPDHILRYRHLALERGNEHMLSAYRASSFTTSLGPTVRSKTAGVALSSKDFKGILDSKAFDPFDAPLEKPIPLADKKKTKILDLDGVSIQRRLDRNRNQHYMEAFLPRVENLHKIILGWTLESLDDTDTKGLKSIPPSFENLTEYISIFEPLLLQELKGQLIKSVEEMDERGTPATVEDIARESEFHLCDFLLDVKDDDLLTDDLIIIQKEILGKKCEAFGKIESRTRGSSKEKSKSPLLKIRFFQLEKKKINMVQHLKIGSNWQIKKVTSLSTINREYLALHSVGKLPLGSFIISPSLALSTSNAAPQFEIPSRLRSALCRTLNESQINAIYASMSPHGFTLLQGPPGTGKTKTIMALLSVFLNGQNNNDKVKNAPPPKVLVCAPSNAAVDELASRIIDKQVLDKDGMPYQPYSIRMDRLVNEMKSTKDGERRALDSLETAKKTLITSMLNKCSIVLSTLSGSAYENISLAIKHFDLVIIDEAAQAVELSTLIPLKHDVKKCILVGDPNQLPPTIISRTATQFQYEVSLFQRLAICGIPKQVLRVQYRMHPMISKFPSKHFYTDLLIDGDNVKNYNEDFYKDPRFGPFVFYDIIDSKEETSGHFSLKNVTEAKLVTLIISNMIHRYPHVADMTIGVITPYKQQSYEIGRRVSQFSSFVEVNTVDGFQGREKDIIIFSCVRAHKGNGIGFLSDVRRMNVGLTRSRKAMFVIGHSGLLTMNPDWNDLVNFSKSIPNGYFSISSKSIDANNLPKDSESSQNITPPSIVNNNNNNNNNNYNNHNNNTGFKDKDRDREGRYGGKGASNYNKDNNQFSSSGSGYNQKKHKSDSSSSKDEQRDTKRTKTTTTTTTTTSSTGGGAIDLDDDPFDTTKVVDLRNLLDNEKKKKVEDHSSAPDTAQLDPTDLRMLISDKKK